MSVDFAEKWFTGERRPDLDGDDVMIINRAIGRLVQGGRPATRHLLDAVTTHFQSGMSPLDLIETLDEAGVI